jgi:hypothetical protein
MPLTLLQRSSHAEVANIGEQSLESEEPFFNEIGVSGHTGTVEEDMPVQAVDLDEEVTCVSRTTSKLLIRLQPNSHQASRRHRR